MPGTPAANRKGLDRVRACKNQQVSLPQLFKLLCITSYSGTMDHAHERLMITSFKDDIACNGYDPMPLVFCGCIDLIIYMTDFEILFDAVHKSSQHNANRRLV